MKTIISSPKAPAALGPYSQAVEAGGTVYLSGQLGLVPETGELAAGIEAQAKQALDNLGAVLEAAGLSFDNVVKTTVLLQSMADFAAVNAVYGTYFTKDFPARACFEVAALPKGGLVEIEAVAVRG